jgi:hypothetical protein
MAVENARGTQAVGLVFDFKAHDGGMVTKSLCKICPRGHDAVFPHFVRPWEFGDAVTDRVQIKESKDAPTPMMMPLNCGRADQA